MLISFSQWWIRKVREIRASNDSELAKNTIFGGILNSSLPDKDKTDLRLASEAQLVVLAGEGTTGRALSRTLYLRSENILIYRAYHRTYSDFRPLSSAG